MLQKSPYYAPIMLRAVPLCPKHASTILQLSAQSEYLIALMNVILEWVVTALLKFIDFSLTASRKLAYCYDFSFFK